MKTDTVHVPTIEFHGPAAIHDQACAVFHDRHAVLHCNTGIFYPSREAQAEGWRLVRAKNKFHIWILETFFEARP